MEAAKFDRKTITIISNDDSQNIARYDDSLLTNKEFVNLKINWMIENKKIDLIEKFLKQNNTFPNKKKLIQYLVDTNIAKANIKEGCQQINFLDKN